MDFFLREFRVCRIRGVDISANPLAMLVPLILTFPYLRISLAAFAGTYLGIMLLIVIHEMGHAVVAQHYNMAVKGIYLKWYGGACWLKRQPHSHRHAAIYASGGVLAQVIVLAPALALSYFWGGFPSTFFKGLLYVFVDLNIMMMILNLIPVGPLDGAKIFDYLRNRKWYDKADGLL